MRGTLTALVVLLLVASGVWAASVSAAPGAGLGTEALSETVEGAGTVPPVTTETVENTTDDATNTTDTADVTDATATPTVTENEAVTVTENETVTVTASVDDGAENESVGTETIDDATAVSTLHDSVPGASVDGDLAVNGSTVTGGGSDPIAVSAGATATTATATEDSSTTSGATRTPDARTGTPTPAETAGGTDSEGGDADDGGATDSGTDGAGTDGGVPAAATGAALVGLGAAAATLLVRGSSSIVAFGPNFAATVSQFPSPLARLRQAGRKWLPRVLAAVGYSRYDDSDPLNHATRAELYELIADSPGTYLSELSEQTDVPTSTVRHHLDVLVSEGVVTTANVRGKRRYFSLDTGDEALAAALEDDASAAVIDCLARRGPASVSTVAEELDRDVSTVSHHLGRLAADGLVEREREGRSVYNDLAPEVEDTLGGDGAVRDTPQS